MVQKIYEAVASDSSFFTPACDEVTEQKESVAPQR
jgi:hypothetical protein